MATYFVRAILVWCCLRAITVAVAARVAEILEESASNQTDCMCSALHPSCRMGWCYNGYSWSRRQCPGTCTVSYQSSPEFACTYRVWKAEDAAKEMVMGTHKNMDSKLFKLGIDMSGLWWMRYNPVAEVLASFAGVTINSSSFPILMQTPNSLKDHWSWKHTTYGKALMRFYAKGSPDTPMEIYMTDAAHGGIHTALENFPGIYVDRWGVDKINEDEWNRPTTFKNTSLVGLVSGDSNYTLTRILREDGTKTKHWSEFVKSSDAVPQMTFGNDNPCMRKCQIASTCYLCQKWCRHRTSSLMDQDVQ